MDSLPLENPQTLKAKLVALRNKASMEGDRHAVKRITEQLKDLQAGKMPEKTRAQTPDVDEERAARLDLVPELERSQLRRVDGIA